jgi:hypothetical protein
MSPLIDTTAASNPAVVRQVLALAEVPEPAILPVTLLTHVCRCHVCGFMMLTLKGCTYCGGHDARD